MAALSRALSRVALANYFAAAVLMPYEPFAEAARSERYDLELLGHRFRASFEQTCHRLTTLRAPGAEGVPFHMVRIDIAGNISKHFSAGDFKGLGSVDIAKALKDGGQKTLESAYDKWMPDAVKASDGNPQKVDAELKSRITKDAGVQKWFADYGKKHAK